MIKNVIQKRVKQAKDNDKGVIFILVVMITLLVFVLVLSSLTWIMSTIMITETDTSRLQALNQAELARDTGLVNALNGNCERNHNVRVEGYDAEYNLYYAFVEAGTSDTEIPAGVRDDRNHLIPDLMRGCPSSNDYMWAEQHGLDIDVIFYVEGIGYAGDVGTDDSYIRRMSTGHRVNIDDDDNVSIEYETFRHQEI